MSEPRSVLASGPWAGAYEVLVKSSQDGSLQPAFFYSPQSGGRVPLVVALHTWSADYRQPECAEYLRTCRRRGWALIHPHFRGPNRRPEACASHLAVHDVLDAVTFACAHAPVEESRVFLVGASGGGHMALVMACRAPRLWRGVSAWVPIVDLAAWYRECRTATPPR
ncbi:MAG: prolyl oligopeptidase family serine peptidase, partial [Armatimonadota bacterium]|nr:prolyl oligopeptidase family serine peptidase [Armatimonadota bacterium]